MAGCCSQILADDAADDELESHEPAQEVVEEGFEPGTGLYPFARTCNVDPYLPGQWNREAAQIVTGPLGSIAPRGGDGMLRIDSSRTAS